MFINRVIMEFRDVAPEHKVWALAVKDAMKKLMALQKLQFPMGLTWTGTGSGPTQPAQPTPPSDPTSAAPSPASQPSAATAAPEPTAASQSIADAGAEPSAPDAGTWLNVRTRPSRHSDLHLGALSVPGPCLPRQRR